MKRVLFLCCSLLASNSTFAQHPIKFDVKVLTIDSNEGCSVADFDGDGKLDVSAGRNWYRHGSWIPSPIRLLEDRDGYVRSNGEWAYDVDGDGLTDLISMDYVAGGVYCYLNPGPNGLAKGLLWSKQLLKDTGFETNETSYLIDITGDGKPEWISDQWNKTNPLMVWTFERANQKDAQQSNDASKLPTLVGHMIGKSTGHGIGFGDLNNDGRSDILVGTGWYECPEGDRLTNAWNYHPAWEIQGSCPMMIHDVNGDMLNDVIISKAHDFGLYLWKSKGVDADGEVQFEQEIIDDSFSQAHSLHMADLDGDGQLELITGKRVRAHNDGDPGAKQPPIMKYYVWDGKTNKYVAHVISNEVGIGLQIRTPDIDQDGDLDIVVAGKEGTQILFSQLK